MQVFPSKMSFIGEYVGPSVEEYINGMNSKFPICWRFNLGDNIKDDVVIWWEWIRSNEKLHFLEEEFGFLFLDGWSHVKKKDKEVSKGLFSCETFLLQVHGSFQQEKVIISIK